MVGHIIQTLFTSVNLVVLVQSFFGLMYGIVTGWGWFGVIAMVYFRLIAGSVPLGVFS